MIERAEELVTVFGGGGFIGRYVCEFLMKSGVRVRVASRDPRNAYFIQPLGQVGQFGFVQADVTQARTASQARVRGGDRGRSTSAGVFGRQMQRVHVEGARNVAEAAREAGAAALVHISAIGADPNSPVRLRPDQGRRRGGGPQGLPERDDRPPVAGVRARGRAHQPLRGHGAAAVPAGDRGASATSSRSMSATSRKAIAAGRARSREAWRQDLRDRRSAGDEHDRASPGDPRRSPARSPKSSRCPTSFGSLLSRFGWLPGAPLTRDQWLMLQRDNVPSGKLPGLEAFGIKPTPLAAVALRMARPLPQGRQASPAGELI